MLRNLVLAAFSALLVNFASAQPVITSFSPQAGVVGSTVTITGTGFNTTPANNVVIFGATRATVTAATNTQLTVTVPTGATYQPIMVLVNGLMAYSKYPFSTTYPGWGIINSNSFLPKQDFDAGFSPYASCLGDLNGDGKVDVIVANRTGNSISILVNDGSPGVLRFKPKSSFQTDSWPVSVAVGDLDGDGKLDVVVANSSSNTVSVFRNSSNLGLLSLDTRKDFITANNPVSVAIGDLDGDGRLDIVVANNRITPEMGGLTLLRNTGGIGSLSFNGQMIHTSNFTFYTSVAIGDIDNDGKVDLVASWPVGSNPGYLSVFRNLGSPGTLNFDWTSFTGKQVGNRPTSVVLGDLDMDGKLDIASTSNLFTSLIILVKNTSIPGLISFTDDQTFLFGQLPRSVVAIGDLDGNGKPDLGMTNEGSNSVSIFRGTGLSGVMSYDSKTNLSTGMSPTSVAIGDLDGDGKSDLVITNNSSTSILLHEPRSGQAITFNQLLDKTIGDSPFSLAAFSSSGLPITYTSSNPSVAVISGNNVTIVGAGSTVITASQPGNTTWASAIPVPQTLVVKKALLTARADNSSRAYGLLNPAFTLSYSGFVNGDNASVIDSPPTISTIATTCSNVGTYPIAVSGGTDNNYIISTVNGTLTVTKTILTATVSNSSKTYGSANPTLTFTYSGFVCTDNASSIDTAPSITTSATTCSNAGTYPITLTGGTDNNYSIAPVNGTLTVTKANLTVTADAKSKTYNTSNPSLTFSYSGFVCSGDNAAGIDSPPTINTTAVTNSDVGTYPITLSGGSDNNYNLSLVNGTLTISKANQTISFPAIPVTCGWGSATLLASASSGLPISYASSNQWVATIFGNTANVTGPGSTIITASQPGNINYNPAVSVQQTMVVSSNNGYITQSGDLCQNGYVTLTAGPGYNYSWGYNNFIIVYEPGVYSVNYNNGDGCYVYAETQVTRYQDPWGLPCAMALKVAEPEESFLVVFPSPANENVTFEWGSEETGVAPLVVFDALGRVAEKRTVELSQRRIGIDTRSWPSGVYFLQFADRKSYLKFIVSH